MKKKYAITAFVLLALLAACKNSTSPSEPSYTIKINMSGNVSGDNVTASTAAGRAGTVITLNYSVANSDVNNRLVFSGTKTAIAQADSAGTGTRNYTINAEDANAKKVITINAVFTHSNSGGPASYAIVINMSGNVSGDSVTASPTSGKAEDEITLSYSVADSKINNLLAFSGTNAAIEQVSVAGTGTKKYTIKEEDAANGIITINATFTHTDKTPNTIAFADTNNETRAYGDPSFAKAITNTGLGTGAISYTSSDPAVATVNSSGTVTLNKVGTTTITATKAGDATYEQATAKYTLTITKAIGRTVSVPAAASVTYNSITITSVTVETPNYGQTAEYAISTTASPAPASDWQTGVTFSGLTHSTDYYVFARTKENENCHAGEAVNAIIRTQAAGEPQPAVATIIDFEADAIDKTYAYTEGDNKPTSVKVVTDTISSGKALQITTNDGNNDKGYNQAAVIPIKLPYTVKDYESFSFKFSLVSGNTGDNLDSKQIQVYIAKNTNTFVKWGFGNAASAGNQFAANLLGAAPSSAVNFGDTYKNKWTDYSITITNPGDAIKDLTGDLFIAIGINCKTNAVYLFDDITFTPKSNFVPPPPPPEAPTTAPNPPSIGAVSSKKYRNMFKEWGYSDAEITNKVNTSWNKLFVSGVESGDNAERIYVETGNDMAYIHTFDSNDVRSEGMSYGMMMCVQMNDQTRFNKLWKWAKTYMYNTAPEGKNARGYFAWQCSTSGTKMDKGPAPDGEEYFITALLFAHARWGSSASGINNYAKEARQVIYDLTRRDPAVDPSGEPSMFNTDNYMVRFATLGNSAKFTDPSYHLPAFYEVWALELENDWNNNQLYGIWADKTDLKKDVDFFKKAAEESRAFFAKTTHATTGLGPDYAEFDGSPRNEGDHKYFEYDAWRIALNIGMDYAWWAVDPWQKTFADRIQAFFVSKGVTTYGNRWTLDGTQRGADHSPGLVGCNAVASLAATNVNAWKFIEDFWNISMTKGKYRYYDGCLYMMSMLHLSGNFKVYLSNNTTPVPSSSISPTSATFDKKPSLQADIVVNMTLNGNTLTNIKNGSTILTNGTDYTQNSSGGVSTVTIKKEYLAAQAVGTTTLVFTFSAGATQNLVITVVDTTNSSISPTTATFDKKSDLQADIAITMTLNGNSLTSISNGSTPLTSGTDYIQNNSAVTIKKEYLAAQAVGTTTLVFTFNVGAASNLVITVKESPAGTGGGTSYNFATDSIPAGYPKYSASGTGTVSATITGGVLRVIKSNTNHSTPWFILSFDLGTGNLSEYSSIKIRIRGVSDDYTNKGIRIYLGTNRIENSGNASLSTTFADKTLTLTGSRSATGVVELGFGLEQSQHYTIEIESIELIK